MKLKTLKDLDNCKPKIINHSGEDISVVTKSENGCWIHKEDLKQEAIKWVKTGKEGIIFCFLCNKWDKDYLMHSNNGHKLLKITEDCEDFIKYFFNITEEDLNA